VQEFERTQGQLDSYYFCETARHYEPAFVANPGQQDEPFYLELAQAAHGRVLEVACGSGRILLPTARSGVQIDGMDFSLQQLDILKTKLADESLDLRSRVNLYHANMSNFSLPNTYNLITVPFRSLHHLHTIKDQIMAFECFSNHLNTGGKLAFNIFYPDIKQLEDVGVEKLEMEWVDENDSSLTIQRFYTKESFDKLNQHFQGKFTFRSFREKQLVNEETAKFDITYYTYPQILLLLRSCGLRVVGEYGSFEKHPISICKEMIFIAQKD